MLDSTIEILQIFLEELREIREIQTKRVGCIHFLDLNYSMKLSTYIQICANFKSWPVGSLGK